MGSASEEAGRWEVGGWGVEVNRRKIVHIVLGVRRCLKNTHLSHTILVSSTEVDPMHRYRFGIVVLYSHPYSGSRGNTIYAMTSGRAPTQLACSLSGTMVGNVIEILLVEDLRDSKRPAAHVGSDREATDFQRLRFRLDLLCSA